MGEKLKKKKIAWQQYLSIVFFLLIGIVCGSLIDRYSMGKTVYEELLPSIGLLFLQAYTAIFVQIIIHEAGHLVFGLLSGYQFRSFRIFSFVWVKERNKIRLRRFSIPGTVGQCLMDPPDMVDGRIPFVLYNLGGSLLNIFTGAVGLCVFLVFPDLPFLSNMMLIFSVWGFGFAIINGVPMRMGTVDNDGYNTLELARNAEAVRSFWTQMKIGGLLASGVRLKDMPNQWFSVPSDEAMKNGMIVVMGVYACNRLMDAAQFEEADRLMAHMLEIDSGMSGLHRSLMICDRMYVELITANRREVIDGMLDKKQKKDMKAMKNNLAVLRTEYAYTLLFEKDEAKAEKIRTQFEKHAKTYPYQIDAQSERELIGIAKYSENI